MKQTAIAGGSKMEILVIAFVLVGAGMAVWYLYRSRKKGNRCASCPFADACTRQCEEKKKADTGR